MERLRERDLFNLPNEGATTTHAPRQCIWLQQEKGKAQVSSSQAAPGSLGWPPQVIRPREGTSPPVPANSLPSLGSSKLSCKSPTAGPEDSTAKSIQGCLCPPPGAAHGTSLSQALTLGRQYYSGHGRQVAPLHYSHFRIV